MNKQKILSIFFSCLLLSSCSLLPSNNDQNINLYQNMPTSASSLTSKSTESNSPGITNPFVSIKTKDGDIVVKLYSTDAPNTVANFLKKVDSGFYNNLTFHRVIAGFMAQGGDPAGNGTGGNRQKSELNDIPFRRGSLGLARTAETKEYSNDSQFFICFTAEGCQHLTGEYVNFGEVVSGLEILDKINQGDRIIDITSKTK